MKKLVVAALAVALAGCSVQQSVTPEDVAAAETACAPNGGVTRIIVREYTFDAQCKNNAIFHRFNKKEIPR